MADTDSGVSDTKTSDPNRLSVACDASSSVLDHTESTNGVILNMAKHDALDSASGGNVPTFDDIRVSLAEDSALSEAVPTITQPKSNGVSTSIQAGIESQNYLAASNDATTNGLDNKSMESKTLVPTVPNNNTAEALQSAMDFKPAAADMDSTTATSRSISIPGLSSLRENVPNLRDPEPKPAQLNDPHVSPDRSSEVVENLPADLPVTAVRIVEVAANPTTENITAEIDKKQSLAARKAEGEVMHKHSIPDALQAANLNGLEFSSEMKSVTTQDEIQLQRDRQSEVQSGVSAAIGSSIQDITELPRAQNNAILEDTATLGAARETKSDEDLQNTAMPDAAQDAKSDDEDEDDEDVVIRPRSRAKRTNLSQEPDGAPISHKKSKNHAGAAEHKSQAVPDNAALQSNDDDDEEGNEKVDEHGFLKGDRKYTAKCFRLPTRGDTYYFLATEIARESGYRDSYLLFNKNRNLKKLMTTESEKAFLIQQELIPYSYRNRQIGVVKALSIYKTFGARVIHKGKRVQDDYFAQRARDQGFTEADFANEDDRPVEDRLFAQAEAQKRADTDADVALASNAKNAPEYNAMVNAQRKARNRVRIDRFKRPISVNLK